jgi:hypothetical protein
MKDFKLDILRELKHLSTPYVNIRKVSSGYDYKSDYFVAAYLQLESEGLIASENTESCGLKISADGLPFWSVVDVYVTQKGDIALNPPKVKKPSLLAAITNNATFATVVGGTILIIVVSIFVQPWLPAAKTNSQGIDQKIQENNIQQSKQPSISHQNSTLNKSNSMDGDKAAAGS